jgi:vancomycin resistance protein YoaR
MQHTREHHIKSIAALTIVLGLVFMGQYSAESNHASLSDISSMWQGRIGSTRTYNMPSASRGHSQEERIAMRLQRRLRNSGTLSAPPLSELVEAVEQRQSLLSRHFRVAFATEENPEQTVWDVSAQRYPLWIQPSFTLRNASFTLNTTAIQHTMDSEIVLELDAPIHAVLKNIEWAEFSDRKNASRAEVEGVAKSGYLPDADLAAGSIAKAFGSDLETITIPLKKIDGRVVNMTGEDMGELVLWGQGRSDYTGSTYARKMNVQKALNQHVLNTVVRPGEQYSFNSTLDGPVSQGNGWHMAKVIFNGGDLEYAPGGGICQASTTVYRAIVNAGFPVEERRAHSLFVSYYEKHGIGIDATIYPGSQDLVFTNDTGNPLLIQSYNDGMEAFVNIFGTPDGRTVELTGPHFAANAPDDYRYKGRNLKPTEIVWDNKVSYLDGTVRTEQIGSRYKTLPQYLAKKYLPNAVVHASAPLASTLE